MRIAVNVGWTLVKYRIATNSEWRNAPSRVHSTNDTSTTTFGLTQRSFVMSAA